SPSSLDIAVDSSASLSAEVTNADGNVLDKEITWTSSDEAVATVDSSGLVVALAVGSALVVAESDGVTDTAEVTVRSSETKSSLETVVVSPDSVTVEEGNTVQLSATDGNGDTITTSLAWSSTSTSVAMVDGSGLVTGQAAGSAEIIAEADGVADTASVTVVSSDSDASAKPTVVFDPDKYTSTEELKDDPLGVFSRTEIGGNYSLDTEIGYPGGSQSMKYEWVDQNCASVGIGRNIPLPDRGTQASMDEAIQEIWIEVWLKWSPNFQADVDPDCASDLPAHKLLFVSNRKTDDATPSSNGRWALTWQGGGGSITIEAPRDRTGSYDALTGIDGTAYWDGNWHKVRLHLRQDPGLYWLEVDGDVLVNETSFTVDPAVNKMWSVLVGRNKDEGNPTGTESLWW
ncbi:MAG: Ig-like domain-containing protein, partial [Halobacteriales archaeon]|nr:Ig-like domain-containing protein [Halobacteriales archaeon]